MPSWAKVSGTGSTLEAAATALGTALGETNAPDLLGSMVCEKNKITGEWTCVVLKFTA